jgi:hypothetical protein
MIRKLTEGIKKGLIGNDSKKKGKKSGDPQTQKKYFLNCATLPQTVDPFLCFRLSGKNLFQI